ncbi:AlbA family DNA-binding domain-containing protein [Gemmata sp.]|uniref:AlbA family DNA-binding domain-containing protein n=1 Tax=Gemmata sp. TaxID=1914242 RepID=UPI003F70116A
MQGNSLAREFFESLVNVPDRVAAIEKLVNSDPPTTENDWFDVKGEPSEPRQRDKKNKEVWSTVLGGFANNQGGVVIWGLDARPAEVDGRTVDAVNKKVPVEDPRALATKLSEWRRQATDPPLPNVEIVAVPLPDDASKGYVVCFIPEGAHKPYRSENADRNYYLRSADNTNVMSRSVLASMFYPRANASLKLIATLSVEESQDRVAAPDAFGATLTLRTTMENVGTATARGLTLWVAPKLEDVWGNPIPSTNHLWEGASFNGRHEHRLRDKPVHPGQSVHAFEFLWTVLVFPTSSGLMPRCPGPEFEVVAFCENHSRQVFRLRFEWADVKLRRVVTWEGVAEEE